MRRSPARPGRCLPPTGGAATGGAGPPHRHAVSAQFRNHAAESGPCRAEQRPGPRRRRAGTSPPRPGRRTRSGRSRQSHGSHRRTACSATGTDAATTAGDRHSPRRSRGLTARCAPASGRRQSPGWSCARSAPAWEQTLEMSQVTASYANRLTIGAARPVRRRVSSGRPAVRPERTPPSDRSLQRPFGPS